MNSERNTIRLQQEITRLTQQRDYQYDQACKYVRYAETLENALATIDKLQDECLDAGDLWKCLRQIISDAQESKSDILIKEQQS